MKTYKAWLPIFSGFYNTIWEANTEQEENSIIEKELKELLGNRELDYSDTYAVVSNAVIEAFDNKTYKEAVAKELTKLVEKSLKDLNMVSKITFENVYSPDFYNYGNDMINVDIEVSDKNKQNILDYYNDNLSEGGNPTFEDIVPQVDDLVQILTDILKEEDSEAELNFNYDVSEKVYPTEFIDYEILKQTLESELEMIDSDLTESKTMSFRQFLKLDEKKKLAKRKIRK